MIPRPDRPDRERLIADLGIQSRHREADVEDVLAALADLGEHRHTVLGMPRTEPRRLTETERQQVLDGLAELADQTREDDWF